MNAVNMNSVKNRKRKRSPKSREMLARKVRIWMKSPPIMTRDQRTQAVRMINGDHAPMTGWPPSVAPASPAVGI